MAGILVEKIAHGTCGSSDGLQVYDDGGKITGYCWACGTHEANPYESPVTSSKFVVGDIKSTEGFQHSTYSSKMPVEVDTITSLTSGDLVNRGIARTVCEYFGVKVKTDEAGTDIDHYYPYYKGSTVVRYKHRHTSTKVFCSIGNAKDVKLFGQSQAETSSSPRLFITEGELDTLSLWQTIWAAQAGTKYEGNIPAVVSLINGAPSAVKDLTANIDFVCKFKHIVLCFDTDEPGREATIEAMKILPIEKVLTVDLPEKDANACLLAGKGSQLYKEIMFKAKPIRLTTIASVDDLFEDAIKMPVHGFSWPWPSLTNLTYGYRFGEIYGVGAGVGVGKTQYFHKLVDHIINVHGQIPGLMMLEEAPGKTLKNIASHFVGKRLVRPDGKFSQEELRGGIEQLRDKLFVLNHKHMLLGVHECWQEIRQAIRYMVLAQGCKVIIIDPMTALVSQMKSTEVNEVLNAIMSDMAGLAGSLDCAIFYSSHLNPPKDGKSHEDGGRVREVQFTGSRAMIKWSHYIFGMQRNKHDDDRVAANTTEFVVLKDREFGNEDKFHIFYDKETGSFNEVEYVAPEISHPNLRLTQ